MGLIQVQWWDPRAGAAVGACTGVIMGPCTGAAGALRDECSLPGTPHNWHLSELSRKQMAHSWGQWKRFVNKKNISEVLAGLRETTRTAEASRHLCT